MLHHIRKNLIFTVCFWAFVFLTSPKAEEIKQNVTEQYENIIISIKDNPQRALKDLKELMKRNNSAAMEYLILLSIYEPQKVNTPEFEQIASQLHSSIVSQYEKIVPDQPFYGLYQEIYSEKVKDDYLKCYKDLNCLIEIGAYAFSKFFTIWDNAKLSEFYTPLRIVVPCPVAQKLHLTAIMDGAMGGHGAEVLDISNCGQYPQYNFPSDVEEYHKYIHDELYYYIQGSIHFARDASDYYQNILNHFDPDWDMNEGIYRPKEYLQALPLEYWAMESYPNYKYFSDVINHGIGFETAVNKLAQHYIKTFNADKNKALLYARQVMTPWAAISLPINKETLRYKILTNVPRQEIKAWIESKKLKGEEFEDLATFDLADKILMISIHRPDVLKMMIEICPYNEEKLNCFDLNTDIDAGNAFGKTALMYAAQYGFMESVKILLDAGADINAQTNEGRKLDPDGLCFYHVCIYNGQRTALMYAVQEGNLDIAKYLIERGADIDIKDSMGMTVYDYLSGNAPYFGNFRIRPTSSISPDFFYPPTKRVNKNVTPEEAADFIKFLKEYKHIN